MLGGLALILALLGIVWGLRTGTGDPEPLERRPPVDGVPSPADASGSGIRWTVGAAQRYQVKFDSAMRMESAGAVGEQAIRVKMTGLLDLYTLEVIDGRAVVGMQLSAVDLRVNEHADPPTSAALTPPFRVRFSAGGVPDAFEFPADVSIKHRGMLENLVRTFQVTLQDGETWVARESNASGTYDATYWRTGPHRLEKTKSNFDAHPSGSILTGATIDSREDFRIDPGRDWLAAMNVDETLQAQGRGRPPMEITNRATLKLQLSVPGTVPDTWRFVAAEAAPGMEETNPLPDLTPQEARREILAVLPELDAATEGRTPWIHRLRDLLRVDASLPATLLAEMKRQPFSDRTRADLYLALELAGTQSAQAALVAVIEDADWSTQDALRAMVALAGVDRPGAEALAALWKKADSVPSGSDGQQLANTATLALGSLGNTLNAADDPDYPALRERLLSGAWSNAESDADTDQRTTYIHALGNTGDASLADDILMLLDDDAPSVRRAAALSLGRLGADLVAEPLLSRFNQEQNRQVRGAIAESLVKWKTPSASAVKSIGAAIRSEPDENTRYHMARLLGANLDPFPENRAILKDLLRTERSKRIRQQVANALAAHAR